MFVQTGWPGSKLGGPCWIVNVCEVAWLCAAALLVVVPAHCVAVWLTFAVPPPDELHWITLAVWVPPSLWRSLVPEGGEHALGPCRLVCVTVALFLPEPDCCWMLQVWASVPALVVDACSVQVALFPPLVETWTIVHAWAEDVELELTEPPPPLEVQATELTPPAVASWRTRCAFVHVQPLPGHFGPA